MRVKRGINQWLNFGKNYHGNLLTRGNTDCSANYEPVLFLKKHCDFLNMILSYSYKNTPIPSMLKNSASIGDKVVFRKGTTYNTKKFSLPFLPKQGYRPLEFLHQEKALRIPEGSALAVPAYLPRRVLLQPQVD